MQVGSAGAESPINEHVYRTLGKEAHEGGKPRKIVGGEIKKRKQHKVTRPDTTLLLNTMHTQLEETAVLKLAEFHAFHRTRCVQVDPEHYMNGNHGLRFVVAHCMNTGETWKWVPSMLIMIARFKKNTLARISLPQPKSS